ncbi:heavy metal tolerance protein [Microdochium trichocladiopsis]|uniref:Heavy metal tolerance protein n=1 Tax=Microdochium trichocladiopsis TaxID=1682393 RepID=A0A9P8YF66_9PEZI|nr:heavy metal tolerance protein [Microdochium trichocladiopsis]KAH7037772.1 heavy metal tolerance protein [Microdochium trichocladiopsis]
MAEVVDPPRDSIEQLRDTLQYLSPPLLLAAFILVAAAHTIRSANAKTSEKGTEAKGPGGKPLPVSKKRTRLVEDPAHARKTNPTVQRLFQWASAAVTADFVAVGGSIGTHAIVDRATTGEHAWWCGEPKIVYILGSSFLWVYFTLSLFDWENSPVTIHAVVWTIALILEIVIFVCDFSVLSGPHKLMIDLKTNKYKIVTGPDGYDVIDLSCAVIRIGLLVSMVLVYTGLEVYHWQHVRAKQRRFDTNETTPLLRNGNGNAHHYSSNGTADMGTDGASSPRSHQVVDEEAGFYRPEKLPNTTWYEYLRGYSVFFPYMWPNNKPSLQIIVVICFILLILLRVVNMAVPWQVGVVTNELSRPYVNPGEEWSMPWQPLGLLVLYRLLQGPSGLLGSLRALLWIPVSQHTYQALMTSAFEHVHSLSLDFHLGKRTGEVLSALNKGSSVNSFLEQITFQVFPMLIDLVVAISYFYIFYDAVYAVLVSAIVFYYLYLTIRMASRTAEQRRAMSNLDREEEAVKNDSIISYETVKYFNAEAFEFKRYREAVQNFQTAEAKVTWSISTMNICQSIVFMTGLLIIMMLGAYQVVLGQRKVGDFVTLMMYLQQLQGPLNFFGTFYRTVQQAMISGERLLELFKQQPSVVDKIGATKIESCEGQVEFSKVGFAYDPRKPALQDLSFICKPGTTTALVGESGGGKSTLFRLMYRYYNCQHGQIKIDDHNVKDVTIDSVRRHIGVVPQDTILFNDTLMYNLKYANQDATDEEIFKACQAASIHERIMSFPDGYHTKVGERGLRLSGGEKQRVAIARTLLKKPKIIMLDEATSALDSQTEQEIQSRLAKIGQGRTVLLIAHRLSTITHADQILVIHQGRIIERGTHESLLAEGKQYADMWNRQVKAERAADEAKYSFRRLDKLSRRAHLPRPEYPTQTETPPPTHEDTSSSDESSCPKPLRSDESKPAQ